MTVCLSDDTKAILLLCGVFGDRSVKPLSPQEYNSVARWLACEGSRPQHLLLPEVAERVSRGVGVEAGRLDALLARGVALGFAVEQWERSGIWIVSRGDADYPVRLKKHIKEKSPPLLFGVGDRALLQGGGLAVVGSRNVDSEGERFTRTVAELCARQGIPVVSGGARGVDSIAMESALKAGGIVFAALADSLLKKSLEKSARSALAAGRLMLLSPYHPEAPFSVGAAMGRNKLIYALSDYALVVSADYQKGGTWAGAEEELKRERPLPVFVRMEGDVPEGNRRLLSLGVRPWPNAGPEDSLSELLAKAAAEPPRRTPKYETQSLFDGSVGAEPAAATQLPTEESADKPAIDTSNSPAEIVSAAAPPTASESDQEAVSVSPAEALYLAVLPLLLEAMREPVASDELASLFDVSAPQIRKRLERGVEEEKMKQLAKPVRYCANETGSK